MNKEMLICMLLLGLGQILVWFQLNGQFVWKWFERNPITLSLLGIPISYLFIIATKMAYEGFDGLLWPQRLVVFALGMISFAFLTWWFMNEPLNTKTWVSLALATCMVLIQVFWK